MQESIQPGGGAASIESDVDTDVLDPEEDEDEVASALPEASESLRYFGGDFDTEGLVRRFTRGELVIPTFQPPNSAAQETGYEGFQRGFVWTKRQMDRFVESILLGYPVPGIFLVELANRKYIVLDGQQRLLTLKYFTDGWYGDDENRKSFSLRYVGPEFHKKTYDTLPEESKRIFNNALIQATIVIPRGKHGKLAVYSLFERMNSGGTILNNQQIRVALFAGKTINLIRDLNKIPSWRILFGRAHRDLRDQELILRYLALKEVALGRIGLMDAIPFKPPMATFMSSYLEVHDNLKGLDADRELYEFGQACDLLVAAAGTSALKRANQINAAATDAVLSGLTLAIRRNPEISSQHVGAALERLSRNPDFLLATQKSTSHRDSVYTRLDIAIQEFAKSDL